MKRRGNVFVLFLFLLTISLVLLLLSQKGQLKGFSGFIEQILLPVQRQTFVFFHPGNKASKSSLESLKEENIKLLTELSKKKDLEKENKALRDQFKSAKISSQKLLPAKIIGSGSYIPGGTPVDTLVIDKGTQDGIREGQTVIYQDNLVGKIIQVSVHIAAISVIANSNTSFTANTVKTSALGVYKSTLDGMVLDNVVLSDKLENGDIVVTKGDIDKQGDGYPPGLVVGKLVSVYKRNSAVFQAAKIEPLLDFSKLDMVFVIEN